MLKRHERLFSNLQKLVDAAGVGLTWALAYFVRFDLIPGGTGSGWTFFKLSPVIILLTIFFFRQNGLYRSHRFTSRYSEVTAVFKANTEAILTFILLLYFLSPNRISRIMLFNYFLLSQFVLIGIRLTVRNYLRHLRRNGKNLRHILLIGNGNQIGTYIKKVKRFKDAGIQIVGWLDSDGQPNDYDVPILNMNLDEAREKYNPDTIVVGYTAKAAEKVDKILRSAHNDLTPVQVLPDLTYSFIGHKVEDFGGLPLIAINQPRLTTADVILKRSFDILTSGIGLILISPVLLVLAILVKVTSKGPIFYGQERMGLDGTNFKMWKFRSMKIDAESTGAGWTVENDPRRTPIGGFLRSTSLDELPQLWNVFKGDMSLVGPRPERPVYVDKFRHEIPAYMLRHKMKAGITGWAQVNGWRGNTSLQKRIECDIYYIKHWSLWFDIKILFLTFWKGFINKNAY